MTPEERRIASVTAELTGDLSGIELEINRELVLSTAHLPKYLAEAMDKSEELGFAYDKGECHYRIHVPSGEFPDEMVRPVFTAKAVACKWLVYDCDGPIVPGLQKWEW